MKLKSTLSALAIAAAGPALADCDTVTFSDVGWTDITATTAATTVVLDALGYDTDIKVLSVPGKDKILGATIVGEHAGGCGKCFFDWLSFKDKFF